MILSTLLTTSCSQDEVLAYPTAPVELIKKACDLTFAIIPVLYTSFFENCFPMIYPNMIQHNILVAS